MSSIVIIGLQWGDEGKGKIVDSLTQRSDAVVRFQGGHNAGHTITVDGKQHILHLLPSGVLHEKVVCLIANGVVVSPRALLHEVQELTETGIDIRSRLYLSAACPLVLECHRLLDEAREAYSGTRAIGTTANGIGPAYEDKIARRALRVADLSDKTNFKSRLKSLFEYHNFILKHYYRYRTADFQEEYDFIKDHRDEILPWLSIIPEQLRRLRDQAANILFEGAQGVLLDVDHGTYPYVTSSNTIAGNVTCGTGIPLQAIDCVLGVAKAYVTRVGNGPFPTELHDEVGKHLSVQGHETGATTGRARRCGWFDAVALRQSIQINGVSNLCLTKIDVLTGLDSLRICVRYANHDNPFNNPLADYQPEYIELPGWTQSIRGVRSYEDLPTAAQRYVEQIEAIIGIPIDIISTGPGREENIVRSFLF